ncbi:MAG: hypothetical protein D3924_01845 [Candidatus Electrothrix sp. AR4]|nr:hypothetical protein [Candidatus Electrothrix sp. AR4]
MVINKIKLHMTTDKTIKEDIMKSSIRLPVFFAVLMAVLLLCSCVGKETEKQEGTQAARLSARQEHQRTIIEPDLLPKRFQQAGYMINDDEENAMLDSNSSDEFQLKVGADITTHEPISLREAMKALVRNKNMSLSWASDVNQDLVVDIDVTAEDNFYEAIGNILRQLDYYHEIKGSTLIVKYRETKQYHIAMPFTKQKYSTAVGGDLLGNSDASTSTEGTIRIDSEGNEFDIWENIQKNLDVLIATWSATVTTPEASLESTEQKEADGKENEEDTAAPTQLSRRVSSTDSSYTIDKPVGLIIVHAPQSLQKRIADYLAALERELYKQIIIEAKIIEVQLEDNSSLGINWNTLLKNLSFTGGGFGVSKNYSKGTTDGDDRSNSNTSDYTKSSSRSNDGTSTSTNSGGTDINGISTSSSTGNSSNTMTSSNTITDTLSLASSAATTAATIISGGAANFASAGISLAGFSIDSFINALKQQGKTSILSNPKISVMNGQPALITVGRNVTYVESVETEIDKDTGVENFKIKTERILSGVGLALSAVVKNNNDVVMNLVPVTSELAENIEYMEIGSARIGLPVVNVREMSTTVTVKDNSVLVLGGLISETDISEGDFLFGTENIPYLKYLFGYENKKKIKRELIMLLRPRIIN